MGHRIKRVLVTGFEGFGRHSFNASGKLANLLAEQAISQIKIFSQVLPVSYQRAELQLLQALREQNWDLVIALGISTRVESLSIERLAINLDDSVKADNDAVIREDQVIKDSAPAGYFSSLPIKKIAAIFRDCEVPCQLSMDAGGYVCNHVFYSLMHFMASQAGNTPAGFIHIPAWPEDQLDQIQQMVPILEKVVVEVLHCN